MPEIKYDLITADHWPAYRDALAPAESLFPPLVPAHSLTMLHGPPGCGKSALLWGVGDAIARGIPYLGIPTVQANTMLISVDMNKHQLKHRWQETFNPAFDPCPVDKFNCLDPSFKTSNFYTDARKFIAARNIRLVMIDALSGIALGHSAKDDEVANAVAAALVQWLGTSPAIILLHHDRKQRFTPQGQPIPPGDEDFSGSQQWRGNCTSQLHMWVTGPHRSALKHAKSQVDVLLEEELSLYIDLHGKAELWQQHRADEVARKWLDTVILLHLKDLPLMDQYEAVAKHHDVAVRTVQRWRDLAVK
jgi:hypothetical protein